VTQPTVRVLTVENDELLQSIARQAKNLGIRNAAIVTLIGAADSFRISTVPADDATTDTITDYDLPAEMTATGEIVDGVVHIHAAMAVAGDRAVAGHLHRAVVQTHFARAYRLPGDRPTVYERLVAEGRITPADKPHVPAPEPAMSGVMMSDLIAEQRGSLPA
jgi:predicted DNA-binding protein with PD1-like motif